MENINKMNKKIYRLPRIQICADHRTGFSGIIMSEAKAQDIKPVFSQWNYINSNGQSLYGYLANNAMAKLKERKKQLSKLSSEKDWLKWQQAIKLAYSQVLGAFPSKAPLNAVVTGTLQNEGVKVEKIYFESLPGYYVTAGLFLPVDRKRKTSCHSLLFRA